MHKHKIIKYTRKYHESHEDSLKRSIQHQSALVLADLLTFWITGAWPLFFHRAATLTVVTFTILCIYLTRRARYRDPFPSLVEMKFKKKIPLIGMYD